MTEADMEDTKPEPKKKSRGLLIAVVLALLLGGGGFYGVYSGLIPLGGGEDHAADSGEHDGPDAHAKDGGHGEDTHGGGYDLPAYVALDPYIISLGEQARARHLKVSVTVEVVPGREEDVAAVVPRINDVLNTYLRAVDARDLEVPRAMMRLRAHMLRRVKLVSPPDAVRDLLFQEFVLN